MARHSAYGAAYQRIRAMMLDPPVPCAHCGRRVATTLDHDPPLAMHQHRDGSACCRYIPSCELCNRAGGVLVANGRWRPGVVPVGDEPHAERAGLGVDDRRWRVPWLVGFLDVPQDATWPRLMTIPHPRAVDSLGGEFGVAAERRSGVPLRWWQRLVATRLLEVDSDGRLVWESMLLSMARQLGKSWLLRELCLWRIHQGSRFGEPQDVLHTGKDLAVCKEVQRPARYWAKARKDTYRVREVNGQEEIEVLADGSRWMLRAKEATYGYSVSAAAADEAWKVKASSIDEGLVPTMTERVQAQLWLVSTAHRLSTSLMLARRALALDTLEVGDGDLLVEWSAPQGADLDDVTMWRLASPHWTPGRERMIHKRLAAARSGELEDVDEPDPIESFRAQWLNQWPQRKAEPAGATEELLPVDVWRALAEPVASSLEPVWVAIEDDYGLGAAVAAVSRLEDGRLEVDGWLCADWDSAIVDAGRLGGLRRIRELLVGASLVDRLPTDGSLPRGRACSAANTRVGLAVFRDLAYAGVLVHDSRAPDLDRAVTMAHVREASSGLHLVARGHAHLVKAAVWAVAAAHKPVRVPVIR